jgi:hypothetical protein
MRLPGYQRYEIFQGQIVRGWAPCRWLGAQPPLFALRLSLKINSPRPGPALLADNTPLGRK